MLEMFMFLLALAGFPLVILASPLILLFRFGNYRHGPRIGVAVSNRWPYFMQYLRFPYDFAIWRAGGVSRTIAPSDLPKLDRILNELDGIILTGGQDIDPQLHGGKPTAHELLSSKRDRLELKILEENKILNLPMLCICRGFQLLTVSRGGHLKKLKSHKLKVHYARIVPETKLQNILKVDVVKILSIHHQAAGAAGELKISAFATDDDNVEALECPDAYWTIGIQWHPELMAPLCKCNQKLFKTLVEKAADNKN
jgi:putative glutamine amidotransferase